MLGRIVREPLVIFLLLGGALFVLFALLQGPPAPSQAVIRIGPAETQQLADNFERTWRRPPTETEKRSMIEGLVRQEVLVREAQALGLDQGDAVIRQRLAQKMEFLIEGMVGGLQPSDEELTDFLNEQADRFTLPGRISFEQVYLGDGGDAGETEETLAALRDGAEPGSLGRPTILPRNLPMVADQQIDANFGTGFAAALADLQQGEWSGPLRSGYGLHLVRVTDQVLARLPELEEIRDRVLSEYLAQAGARLADEQVARMTEQYQIELPDIAE